MNYSSRSANQVSGVQRHSDLCGSVSLAVGVGIQLLQLEVQVPCSWDSNNNNNNNTGVNSCGDVQ